MHRSAFLVARWLASITFLLARFVKIQYALTVQRYVQPAEMKSAQSIRCTAQVAAVPIVQKRPLITVVFVSKISAWNVLRSSLNVRRMIAIIEVVLNISVLVIPVQHHFALTENISKSAESARETSVLLVARSLPLLAERNKS